MINVETTKIEKTDLKYQKKAKSWNLLQKVPLKEGHL